MKDALAKAKVLMEALPYVKEYRGKTVVIKYGGKAMTDEDLKQSVADDLMLMHLMCGLNPVVIHGGGPEISQAMREKGMQPEFVNGLRKTDKETLEVVTKVSELICSQIVNNLNMHGDFASPFCGSLIEAEKKKSEVNLGLVGEVKSVATEKLKGAIEQGQIPVISSISEDAYGQKYNINADTVAAAVAKAIKSEKLIYLTDVDGIYGKVGEKESLISVINIKQGNELIAQGKLSGGMVPKLLSCIEAIKAGVHRCHILNGTIKHALLLEIFTDEGVGTMVTG